jgi:hypothetical protein
MQPVRNDSKKAMTVTTGLSAVEALTKAKKALERIKTESQHDTHVPVSSEDSRFRADLLSTITEICTEALDGGTKEPGFIFAHPLSNDPFVRDMVDGFVNKLSDGVTSGLTAVDALTKAKNEGGAAHIHQFRYSWKQGRLSKNGDWHCEAMYGGKWQTEFSSLMPPDWVVELVWEHHPTSDTL